MIKSNEIMKLLIYKMKVKYYIWIYGMYKNILKINIMKISNFHFIDILNDEIQKIQNQNWFIWIYSHNWYSKSIF